MIYLIYGAPCSGKSTYISEHAKRGDLICDVDLIYQAISGEDPHDADLYIHEIALMLKRELLDIIRERKGTWKNVYVASIANTPEKVSKLADQIKADECILINTPYEVCMDRAKSRSPYFQLLIQEWFETSTLEKINEHL